MTKYAQDLLWGLSYIAAAVFIAWMIIDGRRASRRMREASKRLDKAIADGIEIDHRLHELLRAHAQVSQAARDLLSNISHPKMKWIRLKESVATLEEVEERQRRELEGSERTKAGLPGR